MNHTPGPRCCTDSLTGSQTTMDCRVHNAAMKMLLALQNFASAADSIGRDIKAGHRNVAVGSLENLAEMARAAIALTEGEVGK